MARYTGPSYRKSRRLKFSILETGKELTRKPNIPGEHGKDRQKKLSNYGVQLQEKQKVRFMYGLNEKQFRKVFDRLGFATTRKGARQLVNHGHVTVNGKKVNIPSYTCKPGDIIAIKESDKELQIVKSSLEAMHKRVDFVTFDEKKMAGSYVRYPERSELNSEINESLIVEYYNR